MATISKSSEGLEPEVHDQSLTGACCAALGEPLLRADSPPNHHNRPTGAPPTCVLGLLLIKEQNLLVRSELKPNVGAVCLNIEWKSPKARH